MKPLRMLVLFALIFVLAAFGQDVSRARDLEREGDAAGARRELQRAVRSAPDDPAVLEAYAEFLERYRDPEARAAYGRLLEVLAPANRTKRAEVARRLVLLDLIAGDKAAATRHLSLHREAGGELPGSLGNPANGPMANQPTIEIPGPLRSFARMVAISQQLSGAEILPAMARNIVINGYQATANSDSLEPTEYLKLILRYLSQARQLEKLSDQDKVIRIDSCESPKIGELLRILGYRMRGACGGDLILETVNATRAFITIDSGFPLAGLEQSLRTNRPFVYDYQPTRVPVLFGPEYWSPDRRREGDETSFIDMMIDEPAICRLYVAMSKLDPHTAEVLRTAIPMRRLRPFAHVLDFFGGMFEIRNGKAVVPGGARSAQAWGDLAGVSPDRGATFLERLITRDDGWMAGYFDALARLDGPVKEYLTEPQRLKRFYEGLRGRITSPGPARPVFRSNTGLMLLTSRLWLEPDGRPHVPGNLEIWHAFFRKSPASRSESRRIRQAQTWKEPDELIEALFSFGRRLTDSDSLRAYLTLSDLNRRRAKPLTPATVERLVNDFRDYGSQYSIFAEAPFLSEATIIQYLDTAQAVRRIRDSLLRSDAAASIQALTGIWQILCRQGSIPHTRADATLSQLIKPFASIQNSASVFDAARAGVRQLLAATGSRQDVRPQERFLELLAGVSQSRDPQVEGEAVRQLMELFEAQRLVSLNLIFDFTDHLERLARGESSEAASAARIASRLSEIQLPRTGLSQAEKAFASLGYWTERHIDRQRKLNLRGAVQRARSDPGRIWAIRGQLVPLLRDTLVGFNYLHYAPPGGQLLRTSPLFVRSHDFLGIGNYPVTWRQTELSHTGWPSNAGGRLHGSLANLAYALAQAEQDFMVPVQQQALIWGDLVPQMIISAKVPRWWNVSRTQMHWVGLQMRYGEYMMAEAALDAKRREQVRVALELQIPPGRLNRIMPMLEAGEVRDALGQVTPVELFFLASRVLNFEERGGGGIIASEIRRLERENPKDLSAPAISRAFGTPKPLLTNSYVPELLHLRTFPTLMGYSSRILAESFESPVLFWAALADEIHSRPAELNLLIPEWTQNAMENIFASHLEDWPALLRSMRQVGDDIRGRMREKFQREEKASLD